MMQLNGGGGGGVLSVFEYQSNSFWQIFKVMVHPEMKMHSLSTHHCGDGGGGEVFESTKHFWSFSVRQCSWLVIYLQT